jgi:toxin ParE1/3/4
MAGLLGDIQSLAASKAGAALNEVIWTEPALDHLEAIRVYIEQFNPKAARDVAGGLKALGDSLAMFPHRGRSVRGAGFRELISTYPYVVRYYIDGDKVVILRVRHTSRRPTMP